MEIIKMNSLKNIQPQDRVQQVNTMLRQCYPNQQYQAHNEQQADAVIQQLASSPHASQFDDYFGRQHSQASQSQSAQQQGGAETIHNPSSNKQQTAWGDDTTQWLNSHENQIRDALK